VETLAPWLDAWPQLEALSEHPRSLYHASAGTLLDLLEQAFSRSRTVLMVGHNPGFEDLAFSLASDRDSRNIWKMATGTLGVFDFAAWPDPDQDDVTLRHWVTRKDLSVD
jgi:phosphohistidine phosphatase